MSSRECWEYWIRAPITTYLLYQWGILSVCFWILIVFTIFILHQVPITRCPQLCEDRLAHVNRFVGGLPLCAIQTARHGQTTKIQRRWQCRAQCSGPCLRTAPVPLTPTSLGHPSAVFRSVCSTTDHTNLCEYYLTVTMHYTAADWFSNYINFPVIKSKSLNNWTNVPQQSNAVSMTKNLLCCVACRVVRSTVPDNVVWVDRPQQQQETDMRHRTSCTKALLHHSSGSGTRLLSSSADGVLCKITTEPFQAVPRVSWGSNHAGKAAAGRGK